jgi:hypothetical protein
MAQMSRARRAGAGVEVQNGRAHGELAFALERVGVAAQALEQQVRIKHDFFSFLRRTLF